MSTLASPERRRAAVIFIFIVVLIDMLSFGVIIPVLPALVREFSGGDYARAAYWVGAFGFLFAAIQFVFAPIQGALSDRYGRRPVILLSCLGLGMDFILAALAPSLWWLLAARVISGIFSASISTANAYIADITAPEQRAQAFGMLGAAFGLGFVVGPLAGGLLGAVDLRAPFWLAAGLALLNFFYGLFVLPESLPPERRSKRLEWSQINPIASLALLRIYPQVGALAAMVFLANLAHYVYPSIFVLFAEYRFHWSEVQIGWVLAAVGVLTVIVQGVLVGKIAARFGDRRTLLFGLACGVLGFIIYGVSPSGGLFLIGMPISALWGMASPAAQSLITARVGPEVHGRIQGALMSLVSLSGVVGPPLFAGTFGWFISDQAPLHLPGAPWLIAGVLLACGWWVAWRSGRVSTSAVV